MPVINRIAANAEALTAWRRDLHAHPELGFAEHRTSDIVAAKLAGWGIEVTRGIAGTGLVGTLRRGSSPRAIGIRADMDALPMEEANGFAHRSVNPGAMHACGHDGHTTMLLGAAQYLAESGHFDGTVHFIFQPAEEGGGGGRVMVEEGLFDRFPCDMVFGAHNDTSLPVGTMTAVAGGGVRGGGHASGSVHIDRPAAATRRARTRRDRPGGGRQPTSCWRCNPWSARRTDPLDSAVLSICQFHAGERRQRHPRGGAMLNGTVRTLQAARCRTRSSA